jgi:hypothetical protein
VEELIGPALYEESFENKLAVADAVDYANRLLIIAADQASKHARRS